MLMTYLTLLCRPKVRDRVTASQKRPQPATATADKDRRPAADEHMEVATAAQSAFPGAPSPRRYHGYHMPVGGDHGQ